MRSVCWKTSSAFAGGRGERTISLSNPQCSRKCILASHYMALDEAGNFALERGR